MQLQLTRGVMILGLFLLLVEVAMSAEDAKEVALPELPKGASKVDKDATKKFTATDSGLKYRVLRKGTGAKPHHHPSEQIILVLSGRLQMRIDSEVRQMGPGEAVLIMGNQEHEQHALEDGTRFVSFKTAAGSQPVGE